MMKRLVVLVALALVLSAVGCSSTESDTSADESMVDVAESSEGDASGDLDDAFGEDDLDGDDFGEDDFASDDGFGEESGPEDAFGDESGADDGFGEDYLAAEDGFSDDEFGEDAFAKDDTLGGDDFAEDDFRQEQPEFSEPVADEMQQGFEDPIEPAPVGDASFGPSVRIQNIKYLANESGGTVVIEANGPLTYQPRLNNDTNQFVIDIENVLLPDSLKRPYILKEFPEATFGAIIAYQDPGSTTARVVVQMKSAGFAEPVLQAEGNSLYVIPSGAAGAAAVAGQDLAPGEMVEEPVAEEIVEEAQQVEGQAELIAEEQSIDVVGAANDEKALGSKSLDEFLTGNSKFYGRPISIQVKDADIRDVLGFIAGESGTNMIIAENVQGTISLKLREIPWDQALVTVMKAKSLGYVREGSVIRIATLQSLQQEAREARNIIQAQQTLAPLRVRVIPVSYASVAELAQQVTPFLTRDRGSVVFDERTSSLIVTDTDQVLKKVQRLVAELDVAPAQVLIEGKIVEAVEAFRSTLGINWSSSGANVEISGSGGVGGNPVNLNTGLNFSNLPPAATGNFLQTLEVGTLEVLGDLSARLLLAESDQLVNVISSPRIVTMNKTEAAISQNSEVVSISTVAQQGVITRQVVRDNAEIGLTVTPQITSEGSVIMDINVTRAFPGSVVDVETQARAINSRSAQTRILVKNGQTAVIGGLYNSTETQTEDGTPGLKNIPVLGWLFKSQSKDRSKNELIFFLTPRILNLQEQSPAQKRMSKAIN
jgi:type IV pilus assembly protein PilQ